jgi:hypothetical protein
MIPRFRFLWKKKNPTESFVKENKERKEEINVER